MKHYYKILGEKPVSIVVEMGLGSALAEWMPIARILSEKAGVLLYERAGIHRSKASMQERSPENIAKELYELLLEVDHVEKLIFIAHSQGGLYAQQFCRLYPQMVKGLLLLDPLSPRDNEFKIRLSPKEYQISGVDKSKNFTYMQILAKLKLGFLTKRLLKNAPPFYYYHSYNREEMREILECADSVVHAKTAINEYQEAHEEKYLQSLSDKESFPDIPLILFTHSSEMAIEENIKFGNHSKEFATKIEEMWQDIMKVYLTFSEKSVWIQANKSTHYIHLTEPEIIMSALEKYF
ncbi:MAG TPA: alpha/beta hydrolase [Lachnospiraceae bacterium]|nr:alpha/beta hydrolase [Lachnospiraceae bacterium]